jgi:hypothetical protein
MEKRSRYSNNDRKHIGQSIERLDDSNDYIAIFKILMKDDNNKYTENCNGVFLNLSTVHDTTLDKIVSYLDSIQHDSISDDHEINMMPTSTSVHHQRTYKLSNYEKSLINQKKNSNLEYYPVSLSKNTSDSNKRNTSRKTSKQ